MKIILTEYYDGLSLKDVQDAHVVVEFYPKRSHEEDRVYVHKNKVTGTKGSVNMNKFLKEIAYELRT